MRAIITTDPFIDHNLDAPWQERGHWPCAWIRHPEIDGPPLVTAYRLPFSLGEAATIRAHVSADERYELFLDGQRIGRGPERGDPENWFYETYDLPLAAGLHVLVARVWSLGPAMSPLAQMSVHPGFIFAPEAPYTRLLGTGMANWEVKRLGGYRFLDPYPTWGTGHNVLVDGRGFPWGFERGAGDGWQPAAVIKPGIGRMTGYDFDRQHRLQPATLPPMLEEDRTGGVVRYVAATPSAEAFGREAFPVHQANHLAAETPAWAALIAGRGAVTVPPHTTRQVIIDLEDYVCAYPEIVLSGGTGSTVHVRWEEALRARPDPDNIHKGNRNVLEGKYFVGTGDIFLPDGGSERCFDTLWWQAGRYVEILVETADEPLTIARFTLRETHYPLAMEGAFIADDRRLMDILPILVRGMQMCAHETYLDCPYYEQLMYAGDTRLEILTTYVMTRDDRLPRKALRLFDASRRASGLTQSRYPNRVPQVIPPFALWWIGMVFDYALWRDDLPYVQALMPGVRAVVEGFRRFLNDKGLVEAPEGWNFMDWVPDWPGGNPPAGVDGVSGLINWHFVLTLTMVTRLENMAGEPVLAKRARVQAEELAARLSVFWDERRGLYADDLDHRYFSEHTQCLALLSGQLPPDRRARMAEGLLTDNHLARTTIYFTHYLFETYRVLGCVDALLDRLELWIEQAANGARTPFEQPEPSRSDCHAWGSHPLYHYFASILGIRPADRGFRKVSIVPQLAGLSSASGTLVHPAGEITVDFHAAGGELYGSVILPEGVTGNLRANGGNYRLRGGRFEFGEAPPVEAAPPAAVPQTSPGPDQALPRLRVSENDRFLVTADGAPFFWLGDTAWELFHRCDLDEAELYLENRRQKGFNVVQAVALAELDGLYTPNANGDLPLIETDPTRPNEAYFRQVDAIIDRAAGKGIYIGLLPTWGDKFNDRQGGVGPLIFDPDNAYHYGEWIGRRYADRANIVWILGGDRSPVVDDADYRPIIRAMAAGIQAGAGAGALMTFHPRGGSGSSERFHSDDWLSFNMWQSGHGRHDNGNWEMITTDYKRTPVKPVLDGEPSYEDHPVDPWSRQWKPEYGTFDDYDVRKLAYRAVFAGAFGHTYGHHSIWQMFLEGREPITLPRYDWITALDRPGARQLIHLKRLMLSRPFLTRIPSQEMLASPPGMEARHVCATRDGQGRYAMVYIPTAGQSVSIFMRLISGDTVTVWWYDPRTGQALAIGPFAASGTQTFTSPEEGPDWVLVLDDAALGFPPPGSVDG